MTVPERIAEFLIQNRENAFCDDCLQKQLGLPRRQQVQQTTKPLGISGKFSRDGGQCSDCGRHKTVILAREQGGS